MGANADIASLTHEPAWPPGLAGRAFRDYREALVKSDAEFVYVSNRNHDHATWVHAALDARRHVIVDKPAALSVADVEAMTSHAVSAGRMLAEATTWNWHPQIDRLRALSSEAGPITRILATFSFPPLPANDVRYRRDWGGGVLWDLGPYAVSAGRVLFDSAPEHIAIQFTREPAREVETAFSLLVRYPGGRLLVGHFGFTTAYVNRLEAFGPGVALTLERAFTTPPDQPCRITGQHLGRPFTEEIPACDVFARFLSEAIESARSGNYAGYIGAMLADARALAALRSAAGASST